MGAELLNQFGGPTAEYIVEDGEVDEFNIARLTLLVEKPWPLDLSKFSKSWAPAIGIPCRTMRWRREKGLQQFRFFYEGVHPEDQSFAESQVEFEIDYAMEDVGIEAFPRLSLLEKKYGLKIVDGVASCPKTMPGDPNTPNPLYGQESFQVSGLIWRKSYVSKVLKPTEFQRIGLIDRPESGEGNTAPELPGKGNWRLIGARGRYRGNIWQISKEWLASGEDGWNPDIYSSRIRR